VIIIREGEEPVAIARVIQEPNLLRVIGTGLYFTSHNFLMSRKPDHFFPYSEEESRHLLKMSEGLGNAANAGVPYLHTFGDPRAGWTLNVDDLQRFLRGELNSVPEDIDWEKMLFPEDILGPETLSPEQMKTDEDECAEASLAVMDAVRILSEHACELVRISPVSGRRIAGILAANIDRLAARVSEEPRPSIDEHINEFRNDLGRLSLDLDAMLYRDFDAAAPRTNEEETERAFMLLKKIGWEIGRALEATEKP
jgi:hypothetical protein